MPGMPGLNMLPEHGTFEDGGYSLEAGLAELVDRFETGRLKVAAHLTELFDEYRDLHRENGLVVKVRDYLLSKCDRSACPDHRPSSAARYREARSTAPAGACC